MSASMAQEDDALRKTINLLHKNDKAVQRYFGMGREALLEKYASSSGLDKDQLKDEQFEKKVERFLLLPYERAGQGVVFGNFYARWYECFKHVFESDLKWSFACEWIDVQTFLPSIRSHLDSWVKSFAEKSLVHRLNSLIADGVDLDLDTFDEQLASEGLASFLASYPVLTRLLVERIEDTVAYLYKILTHFVEDVHQLEGTFALSGRRIGSIALGLGDAHAHGETVCCVQVGEQALIYKPRSNREALFYGELLEHLHTLTARECFAVYTPLMVSREDHCWIEKIENRPCESGSEPVLFFQRLGAQVALIHALNGIDFHYENIIACGSSPVLIDLECLFTPAMADLKVDVPRGRALFKTIKINSQSVFNSGFVPYSAGSDNDHSGLTSQQQFVVTRKRVVPEHGFYRLRPDKVDSRPTMRHLPVFKGTSCSVTDYREAFFSGFEHGYDEVMKHRGAILELLTRHAEGLKTRVLIKNTQRYSDFIGMMTHPRFTQCQRRHEVLLATLWEDLGDTLNDYDIPRHEINDLKKASFPCFTQSLLSDHLLNAHGQKVARLTTERPFDNCCRKLENLSPKDKAFQVQIIQACLFPGANESAPLNARHHLKAVPELDDAQYLEGATRIAETIERHRIEGEEGDVGWTFLDTHPRTRRHFVTPMGNSLYNGVGGLAIFYLSLYRVSGATRYRDEAERILCAMSKSQSFFTGGQTVSAYFGVTSYLYVLVNYQRMTGRQTHQATVDELLVKLDGFPREGDEFDVIHGWCGAVIVLVNLYQLERRETLLPLIEKLSHAIRSALVLDRGALLLKITGKPVWTGFSHGISGALHAMGKVWEITRDPQLADLLSQWLSAENLLTGDGFWLDMREGGQSSRTIKWCHGDAGILLSRRGLIHTMGATMDVQTRTTLQQDAECCERNLWEQGLGSGYSLCHGDFGNLLCLLKFYRDTRNEQGIAKVKRALSQVTHNFFKGNFLTEPYLPDLGMMLGITGVGQALLQALEPDLPDVLSLEFAGQVAD